MGRDVPVLWGSIPHTVSIHAPTWGATVHARGKDVRMYVSIHAPTWGATRHGGYRVLAEQFQSTRPRGARLTIAKEVTQIRTFQSTRPRGARLLPAHFVPKCAMFQSTRPRGARLIKSSSITTVSSFNPRAHVGRDVTSYLLGQNSTVSIHAPTWGAT